MEIVKKTFNGQKIEMVTCPKCGNLMPKLRWDMGYHYCVNCSEEQGVVGIVEDVGEGDHCYTSMAIMSARDAFEINKANARLRGTRIASYDNEPELDNYTFEESEEVSSSVEFQKDAQAEEIANDFADSFSEGTLEELQELSDMRTVMGIELEEEEEEDEDFEDEFEED